MYLTSAEGYKNAGVHILIIKHFKKLAKFGQAWKMLEEVYVLKTYLI